MTRPLTVQIAEVEREIRMRREVYARSVYRGKLRQGEADELIGTMQDVRDSLLELDRIKKITEDMQ